MSAGRACHLKGFREAAHGASFNADFLTALVFVAVTRFRIDCLPVAIYQMYHRGRERH